MRLLALCLSLCAIGGASAQSWCGKNYMEGSPVVPPGGQFLIPASSSSPLLAFRCAPAIRPYVASDAGSPAGILIDAVLTYSEISDAVPISLPDYDGRAGDVVVVVEVDGKVVTGGVVALNATKVELPFSLSGLAAQKEPYDVSCTATYVSAAAGPQRFSAATTLSYLPEPTDGSAVVKMDLRTGVLLAKPATGEGGDYETVFPVGFYTAFGDYLATNLSRIDEAKEQGFSIIHPIPTYDNLTQLQEVITRMEEVGIYLMYDMRWTYTNLTSIAEQVNMVKNSPSLLLWYTGDEPDGNEDPLNGTTLAYDLIYELDGYHPVSLCLNCFDYYWTEYSNGADIVLQDTYMIGNNVTFSVEWHTPCTPDYGCCGCDDCKGDFEDISTRMDMFSYRMWVNGWDRTKTLWTVPQGFGAAQYWSRYPTGPEFIVQSVLAINHGGMGVVSWDAPTTDDIWAYAGLLAQSSATLKAYIASDAASFRHVFVDQIDVGLWTVGAQTLVLATNLNYAEETFDLASVEGLVTHPAVQVLDSGATLSGSVIAFTSVGTGGFILG
ncbi:uncharacterized protein LAESUDRAFT_533884 [Laetiporus sulphureus 93-53]|uniref:Glycoside hydrolase family 2 protein n=1 Tax=Laetiporus sulphureus 93-53 TaxID=1314785 RepID=A0A165BAH8_9APHY|nr:uncharacterized protein LAESUDRAFT_533884 [Laetiporus sulphureus 93-53]KZT00619.1 hypothetical protein LAESUDRAFT_533884 [Laetiporus sulphureus 93-53]